MAFPVNAATMAYGNAAKLLGQSPKQTLDQVADAGQGGGNDFAKMLGQAVQGVVDAGKVSDAKTMDMVNGKGDMIDVVSAISQTEMAMDTMVAVRDRVISAYEDIMKMTI
ncbi:MAG: flagellar hook-basal body complex protein FliE [Rubrivivax sp.]